jgi:hypothetical protein
MADGEWRQPHGHDGIWEVAFGPAFSATLTREGGYPVRWRVTVNGQNFGTYQRVEDAKARADWEVWNRVRQMVPGYRVLLARREQWERGGSPAPPPWTRGHPG